MTHGINQPGFFLLNAVLLQVSGIEELDFIIRFLAGLASLIYAVLSLVKLLQDKAATASDKSAAITATAEQATDTLRAMAKDPKIQSVFRQLFNALLRRPK
jgi:hypothetical protein